MYLFWTLHDYERPHPPLPPPPSPQENAWLLLLRRTTTIRLPVLRPLVLSAPATMAPTVKNTTSIGITVSQTKGCQIRGKNPNPPFQPSPTPTWQHERILICSAKHPSGVVSTHCCEVWSSGTVAQQRRARLRGAWVIFLCPSKTH